MESTSNPASSLPTDSADVSPVPAAGNGEANIDELLEKAKNKTREFNDELNQIE